MTCPFPEKYDRGDCCGGECAALPAPAAAGEYEGLVHRLMYDENACLEDLGPAAAAAITALQARVRELEDIDASRHDNDEQLCGAVEYAGYIKGTWPVQVIRDLADRNDKWAERTYAAEARNAELVEALEAYADECDGKCCTPRERWRKSCGYRARAALVQGDKP